ncbi:hypothetical protein FGIG_02754 [Fasciola gigantica]|uniref:Uncharacterized protein n=1 Tax=Fasciola gigantica TaxID=46835 RepID=A0A504YPH4_FASGI|nr:hypothetical protein FGIG_02754 [Fasciola gigantica]
MDGRKPHPPSLRYLTARAIDDSCTTIIKLTQAAEFATETSKLKRIQKPESRRALKGCFLRVPSLFISEGVIRFGSRLNWALGAFKLKHLDILPLNHFVARPSIRYHHEINDHVGTGQVLDAISQRN